MEKLSKWQSPKNSSQKNLEIQNYGNFGQQQQNMNGNNFMMNGGSSSQNFNKPSSNNNLNQNGMYAGLNQNINSQHQIKTSVISPNKHKNLMISSPNDDK
mmetsp:Transcript_1774/g.1657  ORF Transcript_1774/g.1657 Transcript_1774/m.1657 type:complete len:100 (-) Transcript_1774:877-1176(-)